MAYAASRCITVHYPLVFLQEETYAGKVTIAFLTEWMQCLFSLELSEGKPIRASHRRIKHKMLFVFDMQPSLTQVHL